MSNIVVLISDFTKALIQKGKKKKKRFQLEENQWSCCVPSSGQTTQCQQLSLSFVF